MKIIHFTLVVILLVCLSCRKDSDKHLFDTAIEVDFTIPAGLDNVNTHYFVINKIPSFYDEKKNIAGVSDDDIIKILANRGLIIPKFQEINYGVINDISIRLFNDEEPKSEAFYLEYIRYDEDNELKLLSSLTNLKKILSKPYFDLEIRINFKTFTVVTTENKLKLNFSAFAQF